MCGTPPPPPLPHCPLPLKTWATFSLLLAILLVCLLSAPPPPLPPAVKHDSPNLRHITPLLSPVSEMKALPLQSDLSDFFSERRGPGPCCGFLVALFAAFSDLFIHF